MSETRGVSRVVFFALAPSQYLAPASAGGKLAADTYIRRRGDPEVPDSEPLHRDIRGWAERFGGTVENPPAFDECPTNIVGRIGGLSSSTSPDGSAAEQ